MIGFLRRFRAAYRIAAHPDGKLRCLGCGAHIHRFDKYEITGVLHRNCKDPKLVGQMNMPAREEE